MMVWRSDKQLIEDSLKRAFDAGASDSDDRFDKLLKRLRSQDERLRSASRAERPA